MKQDRQGETQQTKMPHVSPGQESGPGAQSLNRGVRDLLAKLTQAVTEEGTTKTQRQPGRGVNRDRHSIGIDLGDKRSKYCFLDTDGAIVAEGSLATTRGEFAAYFSVIPPARIALEVGTHSAWVSELLETYGHEVVIANPRRMESIAKNRRKNDRVDARTLARLVRVDPELLYPIQHRGTEVRRDLVLLRARNALVEVRTSLINSIRGLVKSMGGRVPACSAESFHTHAAETMPEPLRVALMPLVEQVTALTTQIRAYDKQVEALARRKYPNAALLQQVKGVGPLTAVAFLLTIEDPARFAKSREVGPYVGLVPKQDESGESAPQLGITKTGDIMLRRLLVGSAHYILGPFGEDCDLRRQGMKLAAQGGKNAKRRAIVAVARKLAVLLHRLWVTGDVYEPLRQHSVAA
jgi:transposase